MNKKGFTLMELIITIALLGLVGVVLSTNMMNLINRQKEDDKEQATKLIEEAACAYAGLSTSGCESGCTVSGTQIIENGIIDEVIKGIEVKDYSVTVSYQDGEKICTIN